MRRNKRLRLTARKDTKLLDGGNLEKEAAAFFAVVPTEERNETLALQAASLRTLTRDP